MPEGKWVFDTASLGNFLMSGSIFILENRFSRNAIITSQLFDEIYAGIKKYPKLKQVKGLIKNNTFKLYTLSEKERELYSDLIGHLGRGEASCIAVAKEQSAIVVTDDRTARKQCAQMDILVTGTIGILKASLFDGSLSVDQADDILQEMIKFGFYSPVRNIGDIT